MNTLTNKGQERISAMAQFNHTELGGSGRWMSGGMIMLGAMNDHGLKSMVGQASLERGGRRVGGRMRR